MDRGNLSRRGFLQRSLAALAAAGLPAWYAREVFAAEEAKAAAAGKRAGDSDEIIMGAIGIGSPASRGRDIYNAARGHKGVRYVACCDVDLAHRRVGRHQLIRGRQALRAERVGRDDQGAVRVRGGGGRGCGARGRTGRGTRRRRRGPAA